MKNLACIAVALLVAACASTQDLEPDLPRPAPQAAPDPRVGELQTQLTELLERIDVLNHRIAQLENAAPAATAVVPAPQQQPAPRPAPVLRTAS